MLMGNQHAVGIGDVRGLDWYGDLALILGTVMMFDGIRKVRIDVHNRAACIETQS
jgi:hypothetical protein